MNTNTLIICENPALFEKLEHHMSSSGFNLHYVTSGKDAINQLSLNTWHLIITEYDLPDMPFSGLMRSLKEHDAHFPVVVLSKNKSDTAALDALNTGADLYICTPLNPIVFYARITALLRCCQKSQNSKPRHCIKEGPFIYDSGSLKLLKNGTVIPLTSKENRMMKLFIDHPYRIFSMEELYHHIWNSDATDIDVNTIMVYVNRLRAKLEDDPKHPYYLKNIRGKGYRLEI